MLAVDPPGSPGAAALASEFPACDAEADVAGALPLGPFWVDAFAGEPSSATVAPEVRRVPLSGWLTALPVDVVADLVPEGSRLGGLGAASGAAGRGGDGDCGAEGAGAAVAFSNSSNGLVAFAV